MLNASDYCDSKTDKLNRTNGPKFAEIFARPTAFRRHKFSQETAADFRRKPKETAEFCRNPFVPFGFSLQFVSRPEKTRGGGGGAKPHEGTPHRKQFPTPLSE